MTLTRLARMSSAAARQPNALVWAARLAVAGPVLCLTLVAVLHVLEPEVNDSDAVSEYALGDYGWLMNIAFFSGAGVSAPLRSPFTDLWRVPRLLSPESSSSPSRRSHGSFLARATSTPKEPTRRRTD